ncbi:MAG: alpha-1,6-mannosyltransferase, partial [Saprospiraceae bacterium]
GAMIFFLLLAIWLLVKKRNNLSAVVFALSVVSKLLPLMFLPFLIKRLGWKKSLQYFFILGLTLLVCFSPLLNQAFINNFASSLDLYFKKFEFNASFYYLFRWIGTQVRGYNMIQILGPILGLTVLATIIYRTYTEKKVSYKNIFSAFLFAICTYLFLATTVHPWYVAMPLVLCIFTRFRFPVIWSALIMLTYINYSYPEYFENLWVVGIEYLVVFGSLAFEVRSYYFKPLKGI